MDYISTKGIILDGNAVVQNHAGPQTNGFHNMESQEHNAQAVHVEDAAQNQYTVDSHEDTPSTLTSSDISTFISPFATDHYTDFYDTQVGHYWGSGEGSDIQLIWESLQEQLSLKGCISPINVVSMGSGTGREIRTMLAKAPAAGLDKVDAHFFAIDPEPAMLRRGQAVLEAAAEGQLSKIANVDWIASDALSFTTDVPALRGATDLLFFAGGGFQHMLSPTEILGFLRQVARALRTGSTAATAVIVILGESLPSQMATIPNGDKEPITIVSERQPELTFEKGIKEETWAGPYHVDTFTLKVKSTNDGKILKEFKFRFDLVLFDEEAWPELVSKAGLKIVKEKDYDVGKAFYLQKK
ncbi:MAG: hypothetical protein L6R40_001406 [Gallowayella cf. fulva]|nr:MAG: hypothetical protein L6R40_001406 [Xanthomendoza cf. fulva]